MKNRQGDSESTKGNRRPAADAMGHVRSDETGNGVQEDGGKEDSVRMRAGQSRTYRMLWYLTKWMDKYHLDPILGFVIPGGIGDFLTSLLGLPFIYVSAVKVRSLPLTLAVIFNILCDIAIGLIPFCIGDFFDVFNRSFLQNFRLIMGFVEGDKGIISEVNAKAVGTAVFIVVFCLVIYYLASLAFKAASWGVHLLDYCLA